ncbi:hypothetical protein HMI55_004667 [Coelomomyces lativittatus]|nr:hypothetical protein HMI55_004667 [Coelomomyces lativittatus]
MTIENQDETISSVLFQVLCLCRADVILSPISFLILHVLMRKTYFLALERMTTTDKLVLNGVLDHITFIVEIISHHSALAFSELLPLHELLEELFTIMKSWNKQASMIHETVVALCHARKALNLLEFDCLKEACVSYNESVVHAALEACLYITSPFPEEFQVLIGSFTCHPSFKTIAKSLVERHRFSVNLEKYVFILLDLCIHTPHAMACSRYLKELFETSDPIHVKAIVQDFFSLIGKQYHSQLNLTKAVDKFGIEVVHDIDTVTPRLGILECLAIVVPFISSTTSFLKSWIPLLDDPSSDIQASILRVLQIYVTKHGNKEFIPVLKTFSTHKNDDIRLSTSVLMSLLADHLGPDEKLKTEILEALLVALRTPSEKVQTEVAKCLPLFSGKGQDGS